MLPNQLPSEQSGLAGVIVPGALAAATYVSAYGSAADFEEFLGLVQVGAIGSSGTVNAQLLQAQDASGTNAKAIGTHQITAITASNKEAMLNVRAEELDMNNGFAFVALQIVVAVATSGVSGALLGYAPQSGKGSDSNIAGVGQIV